jgi:hypothetical protein
MIEEKNFWLRRDNERLAFLLFEQEPKRRGGTVNCLFHREPYCVSSSLASETTALDTFSV